MGLAILKNLFFDDVIEELSERNPDLFILRRSVTCTVINSNDVRIITMQANLDSGLGLQQKEMRYHLQDNL